MSEATSGTQFERLLGLQDLDSRINQLEHRRATLPEREGLAAAQRSLAELERNADGVTAKLDAVARDQRRREDEIDMVEAKVAEISGSMYGGAITSPRELLTMQEELDALQRRRAAIEDEIIDLMEYAEPLQDRLAEISAQRAELDDVARAALAVIAEQETVIDGDLGRSRSERDRLVGGIPADVIDMYEGLRRSFDGVAVARIDNGTCGGCYLALPSAELDRIRRLPADAAVHCEECGRLLVR